jgi:hypothetical protein
MRREKEKLKQFLALVPALPLLLALLVYFCFHVVEKKAEKGESGMKSYGTEAC